MSCENAKRLKAARGTGQETWRVGKSNVGKRPLSLKIKRLTSPENFVYNLKVGFSTDVIPKKIIFYIIITENLMVKENEVLNWYVGEKATKKERKKERKLCREKKERKKERKWRHIILKIKHENDI